MEEDPTVKSQREIQTKELVISGNGQLHVELVVNKLKKKYGVEVDMKPPKIPYKETIRSHADVEVKYKKQTGGRGQYAHVLVKVDPLPRGGDFEFEDTIFGGSIPKNYIPAVEKGVVEAADRGILAGFPCVDFRVTLDDGSYHTVDSSEMAFKIAGALAFKKAVEQANPVLLEPIMNVTVITPDDFMGDIMGDLNGRRGRVMGMDTEGKNQVIKAQVPLAEFLTYAPDLRSMTGGRGLYTMEFSHYDEVPAQLAEKVIEEANREAD
jgi:elongation factor G